MVIIPLGRSCRRFKMSVCVLLDGQACSASAVSFVNIRLDTRSSSSSSILFYPFSLLLPSFFAVAFHVFCIFISQSDLQIDAKPLWPELDHLTSGPIRRPVSRPNRFSLADHTRSSACCCFFSAEISQIRNSTGLTINDDRTDRALRQKFEKAFFSFSFPRRVGATSTLSGHLLFFSDLAVKSFRHSLLRA